MVLSRVKRSKDTQALPVGACSPMLRQPHTCPKTDVTSTLVARLDVTWFRPQRSLICLWHCCYQALCQLFTGSVRRPTPASSQAVLTGPWDSSAQLVSRARRAFTTSSAMSWSAAEMHGTYLCSAVAGLTRSFNGLRVLQGDRKRIHRKISGTGPRCAAAQVVSGTEDNPPRFAGYRQREILTEEFEGKAEESPRAGELRPDALQLTLRLRGPCTG